MNPDVQLVRHEEMEPTPQPDWSELITQIRQLVILNLPDNATCGRAERIAQDTFHAIHGEWVARGIAAAE